MKSKKFIAVVFLLLAALLLFAFVGCGGDGGTTGGNGGTTGGNGGTTGGNGDTTGGNGGTTGGEDVFKYADYLIEHAGNEEVTYVFEAECTDLGNKSGPAWSGSYSESSMITVAEGASGGYAVQGLGKPGNSVNFLVVCDRDIEDATLVLQLGNVTKYEMTLDSYNYSVRIRSYPTRICFPPPTAPSETGTSSS